MDRTFGKEENAVNGWQTGYVESAGAKLHFHRTGGSKPPVLLAHGITDNGLCWTKLAQALENRFDLVLLDARGHGLSAHTGSYGHEDHVADVVAVIRALELDHPVLIGHSMGGATLPVVAARHPEWVRALVLEDPHWPPAPETESTYDLEAWHDALTLEKAQTLGELFVSGRKANPVWDELDLFPWAQAKRQVDPRVVTWLESRVQLNRWREVVTQLRCPVLLITGDSDVTITPATAEEARQLCSRLESAHLENAGHSVRRDRFAAYLQAVDTFLEQVV